MVTGYTPIPSSLHPLCYGIKGYSTPAFIVEAKTDIPIKCTFVKNSVHIPTFVKYTLFINGQKIPNWVQLYCLMMSCMIP